MNFVSVFVKLFLALKPFWTTKVFAVPNVNHALIVHTFPAKTAVCIFAAARDALSIHTDRSRIDFHPIQFTEEMLLQLQSEVNDKIQEGLEVTDSQMTRNEINAIMPQERTNMDLLPAFINDLRVITIGEREDMCPCAGTHVRNISEIGQLEFTGKKSKGKGKGEGH